MTTRNSEPTVVHLPVYPENAYQPVLMKAQRDLGWRVIDGGGGGNFIRTALKQWQADIIHLHWLHPYILRATRTGSYLRALRFSIELSILKRTGCRLVWTVHNLGNHDGHFPDLELSLSRRVAQYCDLVFAHGQFAADAARTRFRIPETVEIKSVPLPNYCGAYQDVLTRAESRRAWNISDGAVVVGFLGRVEPYKQVVELVQAFQASAQDCDILQIGGKASDSEYAARIRRLATDDSRIRFQNEYLPEDKIASFMKASDVIACPSKGILTSSSVVLGMSFGRPVIAPADGCIPEAVGEGGILYQNSGDGLKESLGQALAAPERLRELGESARQIAEAASPERIAAETIAAYQELLKAQ